MNKAIRLIKIFFNRQFFLTLIVFIAFAAANMFTAENSVFPGGRDFAYFLLYIAYIMALSYTAKSVEAPEGLIYFLNAGYNRMEIAIYFGLNFLLVGGIIILILFPIKNSNNFVIFASSLLFCLLTEFVWLSFGIYYLNILIFVPILFAMAIGVLQAIFKIDALTVISHLIYLKIAFLVFIAILLASAIHRYYNGDLT